LSSSEPIGAPAGAYLPSPERREAAPPAPGPADGGARPVGRNVTVLAAGQLITWSMTLLWTLVVPRVLGPSGLGTVMAAWSTAGILGVMIGVGTRNYLVRMNVADPAAAAQRIGTALALRVLLSPLILGMAFAYGQAAGWDGDAKLVLYLAAIATVFVQVAEPLQAGFQATERMEYLAYSDVITKSGQGLVGIVVVLMGFGAIGVTAAWAAMAGIVVLLDLYWLRGHVRIDIRTNARRMLDVTRESLPYWTYGLFAMFYRWIDFVLLSLLTTTAVVGWYAVPMRLYQTVMFLPVVVATAWLPRFVRAFETGGGALRRTAREPLEFVLLLSLAIAASTAIAAGPVVHLVYGSEYAGSVRVLVLLALTIPPTYMNILLSQVLVAMGRQGTWTKVMAATVVVNPLLNLALIPLTQDAFGNGAIGAAISLLLTELLVVTAGLVLVGRHVFGRRTAARAARGVVWAAAAWLVAYGVGRQAGGAASLGAGAVTLLVLAQALRIFTAAEIALMKKALATARDRIVLVGRATVGRTAR
jgi:O-antigen/teichoic acid export membrane protein